MNFLRTRSVLWSIAVITAVAGCLKSDRTLHYLGDSELEYYKQVAQEIDEPFDDNDSTASEASATQQPRTLQNRRKDKIREMTLMEAIHTALANNRIIKTGGSFTANPSFYNGNSTSIYEPAIQESGVLFGGRGLEAALAEFDTTFSTTMMWGRNENVQNNAFFSGGLAPGSTLNTDSGTFRSALSKRFADGGAFAVGHDWDYAGRNVPGQLFPSVYTGNLRAEYRRPMWAGSGTEYTRIAGPSNPNFGAIAGVSQGVVIARINNDISITGFQLQVRNMVKDVEDLYWNLYLAYQRYDALVAARQSAQESWRVAKVLKDGGGKPNWDIATEPQARALYFQARTAAEQALNNIYAAELRLRRLIGLQVNDGSIIRPTDEPILAELAPNWQACLTEALLRRGELRQQKWTIKSLELQLKAAESLVRPRFDFVSSYQVNAFGDHLLGQNDNDGRTAQGLSSAYETLSQGNQTGWTLGFEFSMPLGFRSARAQVRNYELRLAKERDVLATQELEISHELADAFQNVALHYANMRSNFQRRRAEHERVGIYNKRIPEGLDIDDIRLRAISDRAQADLDYFDSLIKYNQAITNLEFRKGSLLEYNHIYLAENDWTPEAYQNALRRARARSHALDNRLLHTEPPEFVVPKHSEGAYCPPDGSAGESLMPKADDAKPLVPPPAPKVSGPINPAKPVIQQTSRTVPTPPSVTKPVTQPTVRPKKTQPTDRPETSQPAVRTKAAKSVWQNADFGTFQRKRFKSASDLGVSTPLMNLNDALEAKPAKR